VTQCATRRADQVIASGMAAFVVDLLESVQIDHCGHGRIGEPAEALALFIDDPVPCTSIQQAGQHISLRGHRGLGQPISDALAVAVGREHQGQDSAHELQERGCCGYCGVVELVALVDPADGPEQLAVRLIDDGACVGAHLDVVDLGGVGVLRNLVADRGRGSCGHVNAEAVLPWGLIAM